MTDASGRDDEDGLSIHVLRDHVAAIERRLDDKQKSWRERFTEIGASVALLLSFVTTGFTLYEKTISDGRAEQQRLHNSLLETISKIQDVNRQLQSVAYSSQDNVAKATQFAALGGQKAPLVEQARETMDLLKAPTSASNYMLMSSELANVGDLKTAASFADLAVNAQGTDYVKSEALRMRAGLKVMLNGKPALADAESDIAQAKALLMKYPPAPRANPLANLIGTHISIRASVNECLNIDPMISEFFRYARDQALPKPQQDVLIASLAYALNSQSGCSYDRAVFSAVAPQPPPAILPPSAP